jgi:hypothetical protein
MLCAGLLCVARLASWTCSCRSPDPDAHFPSNPQVSKFPLSYMFGMCALFLVVCAACQRRLEQVIGTKDYEAVKVQAMADTA